MYYKQITLNKSGFDGSLYFTESDLPYDREDQGEYIFINSANIYQESDSTKWKYALCSNKKIKQLRI